MLLSRFLPDSELSRLNRDGELAAGPDLLAVVHAAVAARDMTAGRFDPTVHNALAAAGYDRTFELVSQLTARSYPSRPCRGEVTVDRVILATGYKPSLAQVPFLAAGNLLEAIAATNGSPVLDDAMESSVPGLFFTSMLATGTFGPFFAFTVSARASAYIIGRAVC